MYLIFLVMVFGLRVLAYLDKSMRKLACTMQYCVLFSISLAMLCPLVCDSAQSKVEQTSVKEKGIKYE